MMDESEYQTQNTDKIENKSKIKFDKKTTIIIAVSILITIIVGVGLWLLFGYFEVQNADSSSSLPVQNTNSDKILEIYSRADDYVLVYAGNNDNDVFSNRRVHGSISPWATKTNYLKMFKQKDESVYIVLLDFNSWAFIDFHVIVSDMNNQIQKRIYSTNQITNNYHLQDIGICWTNSNNNPTQFTYATAEQLKTIPQKQIGSLPDDMRKHYTSPNAELAAYVHSCIESTISPNNNIPTLATSYNSELIQTCPTIQNWTYYPSKMIAPVDKIENKDTDTSLDFFLVATKKPTTGNTIPALYVVFKLNV